MASPVQINTALSDQVASTIESLTQEINDLYRSLHQWHSDQLDGSRGTTLDLWHLTDIAQVAEDITSHRHQLIALTRLTDTMANS